MVPVARRRGAGASSARRGADQGGRRGRRTGRQGGHAGRDRPDLARATRRRSDQPTKLAALTSVRRASAPVSATQRTETNGDGQFRSTTWATPRACSASPSSGRTSTCSARWCRSTASKPTVDVAVKLVPAAGGLSGGVVDDERQPHRRGDDHRHGHRPVGRGVDRHRAAAASLAARRPTAAGRRWRDLVRRSAAARHGSGGDRRPRRRRVRRLGGDRARPTPVLARAGRCSTPR